MKQSTQSVRISLDTQVQNQTHFRFKQRTTSQFMHSCSVRMVLSASGYGALLEVRAASNIHAPGTNKNKATEQERKFEQRM